MDHKFHTIGKKEIHELEKQTNLTLYPYIFAGELARVRQRFSALNKNKYYLLLNMLVYGFDNKVLESALHDSGDERVVIDREFIMDFVKMVRDPLLIDILKKTPAYEAGCFDDYGKYGATEANTFNMLQNPITGPFVNEPNFLTAMIKRNQPQASDTIEAFCNTLRTSAFLALPKRAFASVVALARAINGIIAAFNKIIQDIYKGIMSYVQQIFGIINGLIAKIQQLIANFLESIIPMDLLCILLLILQKMAGDIPFFTSLMNMSAIVKSFENNFINYVEGLVGYDISGFVNNPFGTISKMFPPEINKIISQINSLGKNPEAFLSNMLMDYGYAQAAQSSQSYVWNALLDHYGPSFVRMNAVGQILGDFNPPPSANGYTPPAPVVIRPEKTRENTCDKYGKPIDSSKITSNNPK
jgi:hypothetical protein